MTSHNSLLLRWERRGLQSALFHLDGHVKQVVVALAPGQGASAVSVRRRKQAREKVMMEGGREGGRSHGLGLLPRLAPHVDAMAADQDRAGFWVFVHRPSHPIFQVLLLGRVFDNGHHQHVIVPESRFK